MRPITLILSLVFATSLAASLVAAEAERHEAIEIFTLNDGRVLKGRYRDGAIETIGGRNVIQIPESDIVSRKPFPAPEDPAAKGKPAAEGKKTVEKEKEKEKEKKTSAKPAATPAAPEP